MAEERDPSELLSGYWFTNWERECIEALETSEADYELQAQHGSHAANHRMWVLFQGTATSIAQLYKDHLQGEVSLWIPFQTSAAAVTTMYKESADQARRCLELGVQSGYRRRTMELVNWLQKKRKHISREDIISYLAGRTTPSRSQSRTSPKPRGPVDLAARCFPSTTSTEGLHALVPPPHDSSDDLEQNLHTFREALAFSIPASKRRNSPHQMSELNAFISSEFARHGKRPAPSSPTHDVNMDSPTHKRARLV